MQKLGIVLVACSLGLFTTSVTAQDGGKDEAVETHSMGEKHQEKKEEAEDVLSWSASAGGVLATGNTQNLTINGGTAFTMIEGQHGLGFNAAVIYGLTGEDYESNTAFNVSGKLRYDFYLTDLDAIFAAVAYRHDRFAGLEHRVQGQLGYLRNFLREEKHRLWGEIGGDLTYDYQYQDDGMGNISNGEEAVFSIRAFVGYDNKLSESLTYTTGLEVLLPPDDAENTRVTWDNTLTSKLWGDTLSLEIKLLLLFDNEPVPSIPAKNKLDTLTTINLVYSLI